MKKLISFVIILTLLLGTCSFAEGDTLTLDEAIQNALTSNKDLKIDNTNIDIAKEVYDQSVDDAAKIDLNREETLKWHGSATPAVDLASLTTNRKNKELVTEEKKYDYQYSTKLKTAKENQLKLDVTSTYYDLVKVNSDIEYKTDYNEYLKSQLAVTKAKYIKGLASRNDYALAQLEQKDAQTQIGLAQRNRNKDIIKLYSLMGQGYQPDIKKLEASYEYEPLTTDADILVANALTNRLEIFNDSKQIDLKQQALDIVNRYYDEDDIQYKEAQNDLDQANVNLDNEKQNIEYDVRTAYNNLQNLLDTIEINKREVLKKEILYKVAQLKNTLKMLTDIDLQASKLDYDKANIDLNNSIMDYNIAKGKLMMSQDIGLE